MYKKMAWFACFGKDSQVNWKKKLIAVTAKLQFQLFPTL